MRQPFQLIWTAYGLEVTILCYYSLLVVLNDLPSRQDLVADQFSGEDLEAKDRPTVGWDVPLLGDVEDDKRKQSQGASADDEPLAVS